MPTVICPECTEDVYVDADSEQGDTITCDECASKLVVVGLDPFEVDVADDTESDPYKDDEGLESYEY
jgi:alpha-aminoadipate/glutamate carrier protein LysW